MSGNGSSSGLVSAKQAFWAIVVFILSIAVAMVTTDATNDPAIGPIVGLLVFFAGIAVVDKFFKK